MARIVDYCTAPVVKRRVSITDEMADNVREILGREMTADDVAAEFENDDEVSEVVRELIAEEIDEEPYPGWAMGLGISQEDWEDHYESVDRAVRVKRKFAAKRAALTADYAKKMERLDQQERKMMPVWSPQSKLIREITSKVYKGLTPEEVVSLDRSLNDLKEMIKASTLKDTRMRSASMPSMPASTMAPMPTTADKPSSSAVEFVEHDPSRTAMAL